MLNPNDTPAKPQPGKTARVRVIKHGVRIGNHICAVGHIINSMSLDELEIRKKDGEVVLLNLNP